MKCADLFIDFNEPVFVDATSVEVIKEGIANKIFSAKQMLHQAFEKFRSENPDELVHVQITFVQTVIGDAIESNGRIPAFALCVLGLSVAEEEEAIRFAGNAIIFYYLGVTEVIRRIQTQGRDAMQKIMAEVMKSKAGQA